MRLATELPQTDDDERDLLDGLLALGKPDDVIPKLARDRAAIRKIEAAVRRLSTSHDLIHGDARAASALPERSVHLVVTSPPYWTLKRYNEHEGQLGHVAVWPRTAADPAALLSRFEAELSLLKGEAIRSPTLADARRQLADLMHTAPWSRMGCLDGPLARDLTAEIPAERLDWVTADWTAEQIEQLPVGLIAAEALLADTGSCVVNCRTAQERLMCYLPPACVVVARIEQLAEHLPAAWGPISQTCASPDSRGETVLITGPSRTSDIEKVLILGVHGPKRLVVLIVG